MMNAPVPVLRFQIHAIAARATTLLMLLAFVVSPTPAHATEFFVAVDHPNASDSNSGRSLSEPFRTLTRAAPELGPGDILTIKAGVYREALVLTASGGAVSPITIRAYPGDEGAVIVRGSDRVEGWTYDGGNVWSVPWQRLPLVVYPSVFPDLGEYSKRRELVFVNGQPLQQVLSGANLANGRFWMDDAANRLRIWSSSSPNLQTVEVAVRDRGIMATGSHFVFRGIRIEHVTTDFSTSAMHLGANHTVEDCAVIHNNGNGIKAYSHLVLRRTQSSYNGRLGVALVGDGSLLEFSETSYNSWRYGPKWDSGGIKVVGNTRMVNNRVYYHTAKHNNGRGIWFDTAGSGNWIVGSFFEGNRFIGVEFEASIGPNWIINNVIADTAKTFPESTDPYDGGGVVLYEASDVQILNNTIVGAAGAGIVVGGGVRNGVYTVNARIYNNIVVGSGDYAVNVSVRDTARDPAVVSTHDFDNNLYYDNPVTVRFPKLGTVYGIEEWSLLEWQVNRGEDPNSLEADPLFIAPLFSDFGLRAASVAIDAGRILSTVDEDIEQNPRPQDAAHDIGAYECSAAFGCGLISWFDFETGSLPN